MNVSIIIFEFYYTASSSLNSHPVILLSRKWHRPTVIELLARPRVLLPGFHTLRMPGEVEMPRSPQQPMKNPYLQLRTSLKLLGILESHAKNALIEWAELMDTNAYPSPQALVVQLANSVTSRRRSVIRLVLVMRTKFFIVVVNFSL